METQCDADCLATLPARERTRVYGEIAGCRFIGVGALRNLPLPDQTTADVAYQVISSPRDERDAPLAFISPTLVALMFRTDVAVVQVRAVSVFLSFDGRGIPACFGGRGNTRAVPGAGIRKTRNS